MLLSAPLYRSVVYCLYTVPPLHKWSGRQPPWLAERKVRQREAQPITGIPLRGVCNVFRIEQIIIKVTGVWGLLLLLLLLLLVGWDKSTRYWGHFWPNVQAPDDRWGWLWSNWWNEGSWTKRNAVGCRCSAWSITRQTPLLILTGISKNLKNRHFSNSQFQVQESA
jgi:hypothetical protein